MFALCPPIRRSQLDRAARRAVGLRRCGKTWALLAACWLLAAAQTTAGEQAAAPHVRVGVNFNDASPFQPELPEHLFRSAVGDSFPVPPISPSDLASRIVPVVVGGAVHPLSGSAQRLTDGAGPTSDDDPAHCFLFDNGVASGLLRISLDSVQPIGQINLYSWHRNALSGGIRAPLKLKLYASDGTAPGFEIDNPLGPGYVLVAQIDTMRPGGVNAQSGQHGASVMPAEGNALGNFRHFLFEVLPPVDRVCHTFLTEIDIVRAARPGTVAASGPEGQYFDREIAPLLARRCLDCHNATDKKGALDLTRGETAAAGGDSGPVIVPRSVQQTLLIERVFENEMPPKHPLAEREKQLLRDWVAAGAQWGSSPIERFRFTSDSRAGFDWWALKPLSSPQPPAVQDRQWPAGPIDQFVLARLEAAGLKPARSADRQTLIRRVTFDLTGLPPTPEEIADFVNDAQPNAYERLVDRLLASPHYGETWGRHWLDIVRYSESQGFERNKFYATAWKYRDWVIQAFNDDLPYDEFVRQQLAGDVLHADDPAALVAAGYLVQSPHDLLGLTQGSQTMRANTREDELENLVSNVGQTFLGLTLHCARCHDHKFDPLYQAEYFQFASALGGLVRSQRERRSPPASAANELDPAPAAATAPEDIERKIAELLGADGAAQLEQARSAAIQATEQTLQAAQTAAAEAAKTVQQTSGVAQQNAMQVLADRERELHAAEDLARYAAAPHSTLGYDKLSERLSGPARAQLDQALVELSRRDVAERLRSGGWAHGFESAPPQFFHVLSRGNFRQPGDVVTAAGLRSIQTLPANWGLAPGANESQRRAKLAEWITDRRNPLPARVIVNRLWHYHFGVGLVDTPSDFGFNGGRPSHPELLDWLASELIAQRWSLKALQREIVLSATYRQSAALDPQAVQADSANRLLWRKTPQRLEAEAVRDAVLAVSGSLNRRMGGPSFGDIAIGSAVDNTSYAPNDAVFDASVNRRTVYRTVVRAAPQVLQEALDCADPNVATPRRSVTTTPLQALSLLNNPFMRRGAAAFADRLRQETAKPADSQTPAQSESQIDDQIDRAYWLAYGRGATPEEKTVARPFIQAYGLAEFCLVIFNSNEFLYVD